LVLLLKSFLDGWQQTTQDLLSFNLRQSESIYT